LGIADATALWCFQVEPPGENKPLLRVVDYYEASGQAMGHYVEWLNARGYKGVDIMPQDGKVREFSTGRTRLGALFAMGRRPQLGIPHSLVDGINAGRVTIAAAHFDRGRCEKGIEALRHYQAEWDEEMRVYRKTPKHDWTSHAADSWRYLSLAWRTPIIRAVEARRAPKEFVMIAQPDGSIKANYSIRDAVNRQMRKKGIKPSGFRA
jgi:phage terminase large subunit